MRRRTFFKAIAAAAGFPVLGKAMEPQPLTSQKLPSDRVLLGGKISGSRLALGTGTSGWHGASNQTRGMGKEGVSRLFQEAFENGINFWDAADQYGSHFCLKHALQTVPRDKIVILTKSTSTSAEQMRADLDRFRKEIGTDYLDVVLLHCVTSADWTTRRQGAMEALSEAQEKGIVRLRGVSCHSFDALQTAAASPWVQLDLARINPTGASMDAPPAKVIPVLQSMKEQGKTVMGMKVFGAGELKNRIEECLRFQLSLDCIDCFTIGFESLEEFQEVNRALIRLGRV